MLLLESLPSRPPPCHLLNELVDFSLHLQMKRRVAPGLFGNEVQKVPLRHQTEELGMRRKVREIRRGNSVVPDLARQLTHFLVRALQEFVQNPQFVHNFKGGRM